ncbi:MAG: enoyl-[acyl-carrier-protein] reductase FabK [Defluviitaleaceae bacterium]|nr:enoyl-[acyl-carrier-protein] reductase FabK [Defluviitaleaceae bacterium]
MLKTVLCDLFGVKYPIFQGGMAWISDAELVAAVSEAGGVGIIAAGNAPADHILAEIKKIKNLTDKPFGVNVMLMSKFADEVADVVANEKIKLIITGAGNPSKYMKTWTANGAKVVPVVPSVALAKMMERCGATAIIAEGGEAGGHVGDLTTMTLVPQVCDAVKIPVIAAGGIGDGRGIAAALMLGACGVQVGTRFLVSKECKANENYKNMILKAKDIDTIATGRRLGHPIRALKNNFVREYSKKEYDSSVSDEELQKFGEGRLKLAVVEGDIKEGCFLAGQIAGLVNREQPVKEIIEEMFAQAEEILHGTKNFLE